MREQLEERRFPAQRFKSRNGIKSFLLCSVAETLCMKLADVLVDETTQGWSLEDEM